MASANPAPAVPKWILLYGCFLALISFGTGMIGLFAPTLFFNDFPGFDRWDEISFVTNTFGIRNLALSLGMILALWLRLPASIAVIFGVRCIVELGDILNSVVTGHGDYGAPAIVIVAVGLALFILPEGLASAWGIRNSNRA